MTFPIDSFNKTCLVEGLDQLGYLLRFENEIAAYEHSRRSHRGISISS